MSIVDLPPEVAPAATETDAWVRSAMAGDPNAFGRLYDDWYDRVYQLVRRIVIDPETARDVTQDTFMSAWTHLSTLRDPNVFGGWLLRIARNAAVDQTHRYDRTSPVDPIDLTDRALPSGVEQRLQAVRDPADISQDREMSALVMGAAAALTERDREALDLHLRYGLSPNEVANVLGMNPNAAHQMLFRVRYRLGAAIRARLLWNNTTPVCPDLDRALDSAGVTAFGREAVRIAERHVQTCVFCDDRQQTRSQPEALFASVPIIAAPILFKQRTAAALQAAGVSMTGSMHATNGAAAGPFGGWPPGGSFTRPLHHQSHSGYVTCLRLRREPR